MPLTPYRRCRLSKSTIFDRCHQLPRGQLSTSIQLKVYESTATNVPVSILMSHAILNYASGYIYGQRIQLFY